MNQLNSMEFAGVIGVDINVGEGILVGARYQKGFSNVLIDDGSNARARNNALQVAFGYRFNGKAKH